MITLIIVAVLLGVLLISVCTGCMVLLDPIIAILVIICIFKLIKKISGKNDKKSK